MFPYNYDERTCPNVVKWRCEFRVYMGVPYRVGLDFVLVKTKHEEIHKGEYRRVYPPLDDFLLFIVYY